MPEMESQIYNSTKNLSIIIVLVAMAAEMNYRVICLVAHFDYIIELPWNVEM